MGSNESLELIIGLQVPCIGPFSPSSSASTSSNMNVGENELDFLQKGRYNRGQRPVFPLAQLLYTWLGLPPTPQAGLVAVGLLIHAEELAPFTRGIGDCPEVFRLTEARVCSPQRSLMVMWQKIHYNTTSTSGCSILRNVSVDHIFFWSITIRPPFILCKVCKHTSCFLTGCNHISFVSTGHFKHML